VQLNSENHKKVKDARYFQGGYRQNLGHFFTLMKNCVEMNAAKVHLNYRYDKYMLFLK